MTESPITYPDLYDEVAATSSESPQDSVFASAPEVDAETARREKAYGLACGICKGEELAAPGLAYVVLSCQHKVHVTCLFAKKGIDKSENRIGGASLCAHCYDIALRTGGSLDDADPDIDIDRCFRELYEMHKRQSNIDTEKILSTGITDNVLYDIMGEKAAGFTPRLPSLSAISSLFQSQTDINEDLPECPVRLPRGDDLVQYLNEKKPPRKLDTILDTFKVNLANLYKAGITSMEQLQAIGFDVKRHLSVDFRPVLPVYVLTKYFDLSYDKHLNGVVSPSDIAAMRFSKREMRLLGITVSKLLETRQCTKKTLIDIGMRPSHMIKFMGLEFAHLQILNFAAADFEKAPLWHEDYRRNQQVRELAARLPTLQQKQKNKK